MDNGGGNNDDTAPRVRLLEARYIDLLEKRIAELESRISKDDETTSGSSVKPGAKDLTSNDRMEQFRANGERTTNDRRASVGSTTASQIPATRIRFREIRYREDGVEETTDVSESDALKVTYTSGTEKSNDEPDIVWTKRFDEDKKYKWSEVQILSVELCDIFRVIFAHDPRMHIVADSKNDVSLLSPFGPLLQEWESLEDLAKGSLQSDAWVQLREKLGNKKRDKHVATVEQDPEKTLVKAREDLIALMERVRSSPEFENHLSAIDTAGTNGTIQFDHLWTIFPPGELVYSAPFMKEDQIFIVQECDREFVYESDSGQSKDNKKIWNIHCWSYDWNGSCFTRVPVLFKLENFSGAKLINTLPCHPLCYHFPGDAKESESQTDELRKKLITRGEKFRDYCKRSDGEQMFEYDGPTLSHGSGFQRLKSKQKQSPSDDILAYIFGRRRRADPSLKTSESRQISGRVMVDYNSYLQHAPKTTVYAPMGDIVFSSKDDECACGSCVNNVELRKNQRRNFDRWPLNQPFKHEEQYLLCPPRVLGYHLDTRTWLELQISSIKAIEQEKDDEAFNKLQLEEDNKELIKNLVQSHSSSTMKKPLMEDIKGKGKGLIMLLHGPPGVGKTLTAESVASLTGKPLFAVSPSDIGLDPAEVEHNLDSLFNLADRWHAVLLFDEADVFLESRSANTSDLTRNALVSVLLRVLEYYQGILILTTNRIKQFDPAVLSRVNLGIKYDRLEPQDKFLIFRQFIDTLKKKNVEDREGILEWFNTKGEAKKWFKPLNGRQVRNVLFSAAALGSMGNDKLCLEDIRTMARITFEFQDSLQALMERAQDRNEAGRLQND